MGQALDPIPQSDPLIDKSTRMMDRWYRWLSALVIRIVATPNVVSSVHRTGLGASIAPATLYTPANPGAYRVSWSLQVRTVASVSSSIAMTLHWTVNAVAQSQAFTALTGNATTTQGSDTILIYPDAQVIQYETTYVSVGAPAMAYDVTLTVEAVT